MPNLEIQREAIYKKFTKGPGACPKCGGVLEQASVPYMIITRTGSRIEDSFLAGSDFGWFCQSCPVVVLNLPEIQKMMGYSKPGWKVGQEFSVVGIMNLAAVPEDKKHLPISSPEMPNVLVKFRSLEAEAKPASRKSHKKR